MTRIKKVADRVWPDMKAAGLAGAVFLVYYQIVHSVFGAFCPLLVLTGIPCAGCGLTRAALYLLQGEVARAAHINPSIFLIVIFLLYCGYFRYIRGVKVKRPGLALGLLVAGMLVVYGSRMYFYFPERAPYVYQSNNIAARWIPEYDQWVGRALSAIRDARG
ncbi:MAG: DUF2752 domain-containing protein [Lachnospiraceae bacterium]|nr:DUF2752 domain-containing protein [Lachnospiraceae bacterium]